MMKVIEAFVDLTDNNYLYHPGDIFPREGLKVSEGRIAFLSSGDNLVGRPVIAVEPEPIAEVMPEPIKPKRGRKKNAD